MNFEPFVSIKQTHVLLFQLPEQKVLDVAVRRPERLRIYMVHTDASK
jgi:hypothetical protein